MESRHEIIDFGSNIPIKLFLHKVGDVSRHWHQSLELLLVLSEGVTIVIDNNSYFLEENDVILVNSNQTHELHGENCVIAALQIKLSMFDNKLVDEKTLLFDCNSTNFKNKDQFDNIKAIIAEMVKFNSEKNTYNEILNKSYAYKLLYELITRFKSANTGKNYLQTKKHLDRLTHIINYLNENYTENITLKSLSEREYLSVSYLSRFFEKNMGVNFSSYLNGIRLSHAINDLLSTSLSIEKIAQANGFKSPRAFVDMFKKEYGMLPSQYRKQKNTLSGLKIRQNNDNSVNYLTLEQSGHLGKLAKYLDEKAPKLSQLETPVTILETDAIDVNAEGNALKHTFKTFLSVGRAKDIFFAEIQDMLKTAQQEIGFKYLKFHGLFDDDMMVYDETKDGAVDLNFVYIDKIFDFLLSINLKPFIQISFMPSTLAKNPNKTIFYNKLITSEPKDLEKWNYLVTEFTRHVINRYGENEVLTWLFSLWNEPDTPQSMFGFGDDDSSIYHELYLNTYRSVKAVHKALLFGSPSIITPTIEKRIWMEDFSNFCKAHSCIPDFIVFNFYPLVHGDILKDSFNPINHRLLLSKDPDYLKKFIHSFKDHLSLLGLGKKPLYLIEWNSTSSHRDLLNDTCFEASYLVKNILENYDELDSFGHWVLTDLIEENRASKELFHGGLGMFTYNSIKKPGYYAYSFMSKLGNTLLQKGDGYFITKGNGGFQIMLYNYQHYSDLYASGELFDMTFTSRYTPFINPHRLKISMNLTSLENGDYLISEYFINQHHGSVFDKWIEIGAQPLTNPEEQQLLAYNSAPMLTKSLCPIVSNHLKFTAALEPHEIRFIEIKRIK